MRSAAGQGRPRRPAALPSRSYHPVELRLDPARLVRVEYATDGGPVDEGHSLPPMFIRLLGRCRFADSADGGADLRTGLAIPASLDTVQLHPLLRALDIGHAGLVVRLAVCVFPSGRVYIRESKVESQAPLINGHHRGGNGLTLGYPRPKGTFSQQAARRMNMVRIESTPDRRNLGRCVFLIDLEGHR